MKIFVKLLISFCSIVCISFHVNAAIVKSINIEGNSRVSDETIKVYGQINLNENIDEIKLNKILNNLYSTNFFEDVKVNLKDGVLKIVVDEYPVVNQLIINGESSSRIKEEIKKQIFTKVKRSFIKSSLSRDIDLIKNLYSS